MLKTNVWAAKISSTRKRRHDDESKERKSLASKFQSLISKSAPKLILENITQHISQLKLSSKEFLMTETPKNNDLLRELVASDTVLKKLKIQLHKYPQKISGSDDQTYEIPTPKKNQFQWEQKGKLPDNLS